MDDALTESKKRFAQEFVSGRRLDIEPLVADQWVVISLLQKSIRRGEVATAQRAAFTLFAQKGSAIWRRFMVIAFEDVGAASPDAVAMTIAASTNSSWRRKNGGELHIAVQLALTAWEQYRWQIMLIAAALVIQTTLIIWLYYEHRRRRYAEANSRSALAKFADMNRVATAGELRASIAHEIKQPLATMVANANAGLRWLAKEIPDLGETRDAMKNVVSAGHRAGEVIGSVQAMFKKDSQVSTPLDLNKVIYDVLGLVHGDLETQGILVQSGLTRPLPLVLGHKGQLQQVILNLVRNAADAMDSVSGRARILTIKTAIHGSDGVLLSVEDSGTGIAAKDIDRIFESFFTTKSQGMGMGLSICRSIIETHNGRLWASPGVDYGSVFNIMLPAIKRQN